MTNKRFCRFAQVVSLAIVMNGVVSNGAGLLLSVGLGPVVLAPPQALNDAIPSEVTKVAMRMFINLLT